jgi:hypothetical protein
VNLANGIDDNGKRLSDRGILEKLDTRLDGVEGTLKFLDVALRGDGTEQNPGVVTMCKLHRQEFHVHLDDHKKILRRNEKVAAGLGAFVGGIAGSLGTIYDWLHKLGIL